MYKIPIFMLPELQVLIIVLLLSTSTISTSSIKTIYLIPIFMPADTFPSIDNSTRNYCTRKVKEEKKKKAALEMLIN